MDTGERLHLLDDRHIRIKAAAAASRLGISARCSPGSMKRCLACKAVFEGNDWTCPCCGTSPPADPFPRFTPVDAPHHFPASSFELLHALEERSFWFRARNTIVLEAIAAYAPDPTAIFELGCGTGFVLQALAAACPHARLVGGELGIEGLRIAQTRVPAATFVQVDGRELPFRAEFQLIGAFDVLEHIAEDEAVLEELRAALIPQGTLIVTVPQHPWLWSAADEYGEHVRRYTRRELLIKLERNGLRVVYVTSFMMTVLPLMALARRRQQDVAAFDPKLELRVPRRLDRVLERLVRTERHAVRHGLSLPVGGSLLAVAVPDSG
jgi:SAM-dependent methyltransferase